MFQFLSIKQGIELTHTAQLPSYSGLGSSSSFTLALLMGLREIKGERVEIDQLIQEARFIETKLVFDRIGKQDYLHCAKSQFLCFYQFRPFTGKIVQTPLNLGESELNDLESHLILVLLPQRRKASDIVTSFVGNIEKDNINRKLEELVWRARENIERLDWEGLGITMNEGWSLKRQLSDKVSTQIIDEITNVVKESGALSSRILGAGGGGTLLILCKPKNRRKVLDSLIPFNVQEIPFKFTDETTHIC